MAHVAQQTRIHASPMNCKFLRGKKERTRTSFFPHFFIQFGISAPKKKKTKMAYSTFLQLTHLTPSAPYLTSVPCILDYVAHPSLTAGSSDGEKWGGEFDGWVEAGRTWILECFRGWWRHAKS